MLLNNYLISNFLASRGHVLQKLMKAPQSSNDTALIGIRFFEDGLEISTVAPIESDLN
jgi:hypothetical protein